MVEYLYAVDNIRSCIKLDMDRLLVRTKHSKVLTEDIEVQINGHYFNVKLVADSHMPLRSQIPDSSDQDSQTEDSGDLHSECQCQEENDDLVKEEDNGQGCEKKNCSQEPPL